MVVAVYLGYYVFKHFQLVSVYNNVYIMSKIDNILVNSFLPKYINHCRLLIKSRNHNKLIRVNWKEMKHLVPRTGRHGLKLHV